jgi:hypothetical protein
MATPENGMTLNILSYPVPVDNMPLLQGIAVETLNMMEIILQS